MNLSSTVAAEGFVHAPQSTEAFHMITLGGVNVPTAVYLRDLRQRFDKPFLTADGETPDKVQYCHNSFNRLMTIWGTKLSEETGVHLPWNSKRKLGHDLLVTKLVDERIDTWSLADQMIEELISLGINPKDVPKKMVRERRREAIVSSLRPTITGRTERISRCRKRWTEDEDAVIIDAKKNKIPLVQILDKLPDRYPNDVYSRWKFLVRKNNDLAKYN